MHRKPLMFCGFTAMMGIFGAFLRWLQNLQGFDPDTGLAITYSPLHYIMIAFILGFGVWLWLYLRGLKNYTMPLKYPESFACPTKLWQVGSVVFSHLAALFAFSPFQTASTVKIPVTVGRRQLLSLYSSAIG